MEENHLFRGGYAKLFQNFDTLTTRYPPQIGWIPGVIGLKISAITMLYTSKIHVIALNKFFSVITYFKKIIHPKSTKMTKMCDKKNLAVPENTKMRKMCNKKNRS